MIPVEPQRRSPGGRTDILHGPFESPDQIRSAIIPEETPFEFLQIVLVAHIVRIQSGPDSQGQLLIGPASEPVPGFIGSWERAEGRFIRVCEILFFDFVGKDIEKKDPL